jgi:hypothetical protein
MLYREIIAVCSEIHKKHVNTLCGQNVEYIYIYIYTHTHTHTHTHTSPYRVINSLRHGYKIKLVNVV